MACYTPSVAKKSSDEVREVVHPGPEGDQGFIDEQNKFLSEYKLTGVNPGYIDPTRDQEPDIAPEFGVAPHPELFNPAPPAESFSGRALDESAVPMVKAVGEKEADAKDATEAFNKVVEAREELFKATNDVPYAAPAQPVYMVDAPEKSDAQAETSTPVGDESVVLAQTANAASGAEAQLATSGGDVAESGVDGVNADHSDSKSDSKKS